MRWCTQIFLKDKKKPIEVCQKKAGEDGILLSGAQDVAHKVFRNGYVHFHKDGKEIYLPSSLVEKVIILKKKEKEDKDGQ